MDAPSYEYVAIANSTCNYYVAQDNRHLCHIPHHWCPNFGNHLEGEKLVFDKIRISNKFHDIAGAVNKSSLIVNSIASVTTNHDMNDVL